MNASDATLVAQACRQDAQAFEVLIRRYFRAAYLVALAQLGEPAEAEDACQDALIRAWEHITECRDGERFGPWLLRIVRNTAHNRRAYLRVRTTSALETTMRADVSSQPSTTLAQRELSRSLQNALSKVSEVQRAVTLLHDLEGWRHREIAEALEISEEMSRRHLSDARKRLRVLLSQTHEDEVNT